ncbi:hypothetical protein A3758_00270 [Oleiphilus sp. HI0118]|uniref:DUF302 domain-containing protein n=2 Tax=Oleiphilus TaxID=141450 RepID=UPI0007C2E076|nr:MULTISPECIES: DUF302 domain-containing protein [unclassified Oleiphilus]KZY73721.1 hypothetical protein A3737_26345 [Oleiphilus sp. HI0065]KZY97890.1 hypothetical protein A3744_01570 [Oleiphilus sp. HI0073]KZZ54724.1 hypothetical protein A3758_00270 [Oleiphilus sp. HI0118]
MALNSARFFGLASLLSFGLAACGSPEAILPDRYSETDQFVSIIKTSIARNPDLALVNDIDHSRLAVEAGSSMGPARVVLFSDVQLETAMIRLNPLVALDLPMRVLAYESPDDASSKLTYNSFDYISSRYQLADNTTKDVSAHYRDNIKHVLAGTPSSALVQLEDNRMQPDGIVTFDSPYDFDKTLEIIYDAIDAQDDTVRFGAVDFQANAKAIGVDLLPAYLILFGGPAPGGQAMADAPTLGLDAFCQKFLVWTDPQGITHLSFNDLLAIADRQNVHKAIALRVINKRLSTVFGDALDAD